jgi:hypothetical protein
MKKRVGALALIAKPTGLLGSKPFLSIKCFWWFNLVIILGTLNPHFGSYLAILFMVMALP